MINVTLTELSHYSEPVFNVRHAAANIVGASDQMMHLFHILNYVSSIRNPVIITGEDGTERDLAARAIHTNADNPKGLEIKTYSAEGLSMSLVNRNFGFEGGTLILSEIEKLDEEHQKELLKYFQRQGTGMLGSPLPVRFIGTSTSTLEELTADNSVGEFMRTLSPLPLVVPPLRERESDIPLIAENVLFGLRGNNDELTVSERDVELLSAYTWPGNVTELGDMVREAYTRAADEEKKVAQQTFDVHLERVFQERVQVADEALTGAVNIPLGEKWYSHGVVPVVVRTFSNMKGAHTEERILQAVRDGHIYAEKVGGDIIAYLTPANKRHAINNRMKFADEIERDMHNSRFDPSRPFEIQTMNGLARVTERDTRELHQEVEGLERRFDVPYTEKLFFAVGDDDVERFISEDAEGRDKTVRRWRRGLVENYRCFDSWEPGQVPPDFLDDVALDTELLRQNARETATPLFPGGAAVVPVSVLRGFASTIASPAITELIREGVYYGGVIKGTSKGESPRVLVVEPHNADALFKDRSSGEYSRIRSDMRNSEFSEFAQQGPWKLYDATDINNVLGIASTDSRIRETLETNQQHVCVVPNFGKPSKFTYYALNLGTARYAIPRSMDG